jgi:hypothetical protein
MFAGEDGGGVGVMRQHAQEGFHSTGIETEIGWKLPQNGAKMDVQP